MTGVNAEYNTDFTIEYNLDKDKVYNISQDSTHPTTLPALKVKLITTKLSG